MICKKIHTNCGCALVLSPILGEATRAAALTQVSLYKADKFVALFFRNLQNPSNGCSSTRVLAVPIQQNFKKLCAAPYPDCEQNISFQSTTWRQPESVQQCNHWGCSCLQCSTSEDILLPYSPCWPLSTAQLSSVGST